MGTGFVSPPASEKITTWLDGQFDTRDNTLEGIDYEEEFFPFVGDTTLGDGVQSGVVHIDDAIASTAGPQGRRRRIHGRSGDRRREAHPAEIG